MLISNKNKAAAVNDRSVMTEWIHPTEVERMDVMDVFSTAYIYIYIHTTYDPLQYGQLQPNNKDMK